MAAEMRFHPPERVEMLAGPEQVERGPELRLVPACDRLPNAFQQAPAALLVTRVWRWHRRAADERVAERDVPGTHRVDLAVEVSTAARESCLAVGHPGERRQRLRGSPDTRGRGDKCPDALAVRGLGAALGKVLTVG